MAKRVESWECEKCQIEYGTEIEADTCHWVGLEIREVSDVRLGVDFDNGSLYLVYELVMWFKNSELRLRIRDTYADNLEVLEVLFADDWYSEYVGNSVFRTGDLMEILGDRYNDEIAPLLGDIKFEIPLPPKETWETPSEIVE